MSDQSLIRVHSCWTLGEAEIVRMRLASEGILSYFENANFINWCWYYANAVGGIKLLVRRPDADEARRILSIVDHHLDDDGSPWTCSRCGQTVYETWRVCWSCSAPIEGDDVLEPAPEEPLAGSDRQGLGINWAATIPSVVMVLSLLVIFCGASPATVVMLLLSIVLTFLVFGRDMGRRYELAPRIAPDADGDDRLDDLAAWAADEKALLAWQAAVFGCLGFPLVPFSACFFPVYSIWLLLGRLRDETSLSRIGRRRIRAAWTANAIAILLFVVILSALFADSFRGLLWRYTSLLNSLRDLLM